jgi:hypothetical protein
LRGEEELENEEVQNYKRNQGDGGRTRELVRREEDDGELRKILAWQPNTW